MYDANTAQLTLNGFAINSVSAGGDGGVIWMNNASTLNLNNMSFDNVQTTSGSGGIAFSSATGGVINVNGGNFKNTNNIVNASSSGGAFDTMGAINISGTTVFDGLRSGGNGGVITIRAGQTTVSGNTTFSNSKAVNYGGAVRLNAVTDGSSRFTVNAGSGNNVTFQNNTAQSGGAISLANGANLALNATNGGTIVFSGNSGTATGDASSAGAILSETSNIVIKSDGANSLINFSGNTAASRGGAIYLLGTPGTNTMNITASNGGTVKFENNTDKGLSDGSYGSGAIGVLGNNVNITADGGTVTFSGNKTSAGGTLSAGALFIDSYRGGSGTDTTFKLSTTNANSSIVFSNNTISGGTARDIAVFGGNLLVDGAGGYVALGGGISGGGTLTKSGNNALIFSGDNSLYSGTFTQTGGATKFNTAATLFGTSVANTKIQGGEQQIVLTDASNANTSKAKGTFSSDGALAYLASTSNAITAVFANPSNVNFSDSTDIIFGANYNLSANTKIAANYILNADSDFSKTNLGRVIFRDSTLKINQTSYTKNYGLNNTLLDLRNSAAATATFANLTSANNSSVALDAVMTAGALTSDKLAVTTATGGANTIALANVNLTGLSSDNGSSTTYSTSVLSGLTFSGVNVSQYANSPIYKYLVGVNGTNLTLTATGFTDGNSLDAVNKLTGTRKFDFGVYGTATNQTYATSGNLSNAGTGTFSVLGRSGYNDVINAGGHTLFNLTDSTALTVKDITLTGASGHDITLANVNASVIFDGVVSISDGISGVAGSAISKTGTLNLGGDNSGFLGTFSQNSGTTNVSGKYFGGVSNISGGTMNMNAGSSISSGTIFAIGNGATLNLNNTDTMNLAAGQLKNYAGVGGTVNKSGTGNININGDNSGFTGAFVQTAGTTTVSSSGRMFGGTNTINGGILNVSGDSIYYKTSVGASGIWNHFATTNANNNISNATVGLNGGTANLHDGTYTLASAISGGGNLNFINSKVSLGASNYTGTTAYGLNNSVLNLNNNASFTTLNVANSSLSLDVSFASANTITTNTLTTANSGQAIGLSSVKLLNDNLYNGIDKTFSYQTLHGLTWAADNEKFALATSTWQYEASVAGDSLTLTVVDAANNMTLDTMNKMDGMRGFNFSNVGSETYAVGANLSPMAAGDFIVQGNGSANVLDGAGYSLFDMENATDFTLQNLSITNAHKTGGGSVIYTNNSGAVATVRNARIYGNSASGDGTINLQRGTGHIQNSVLSDNTAGGRGGAVYVSNQSGLTIIDSSFSNNTANGVANDIYTDGVVTVVGGGTTTITGGIAGTGNVTKADIGTFVLGGDNSGFTGGYIQHGGAVIFDGKFFAGSSKVNGGVLEWKTGGALSDTSAINVANGGQLLITNANDFSVKGTQLTGDGLVSKTSAANMTIVGDASSFVGTYNQTAGTTIAGASDKFFGGENIIENSLLAITANNIYYKTSIANGGHLTHSGSGAITNNLKFTGTGGSMFFGGTGALYSIAAKIDNGNSNNVDFQNSTISLGATDFTGSTIYSLDNSTLDLRSGALENISFTNLNLSNNSKLSLNLNLTDLTGDTLSLSNTGQTIGLGQIALLSDADSGGDIVYTFDILNGLTFSGLSDTATVTTSAYKYRVETSGAQIILTAIGADSDTLYKQNALNGTRSFDFHIYNNSGEYTDADVVRYFNTSALSTTAAGVFNVIGRNSDASKTVIDGALADGGYGTLFNLANNTTLNVSDLTLRNVVAEPNDGPALNSSNAVAVANLSNVIIADNRGKNGGAIYNKSAIVNINGGTFENNTAATNGGAIYNAGLLNLNTSVGRDITFANNTANGVGNDIYNATTMNITGGGNVHIGGGISGTGTTTMNGNGTLNLGGDNSGYTGLFRQTDGVVNVSGIFFAGNSNIQGGIINFNNGSSLSGTSNISMNQDIVINIAADDFALGGQITDAGTINRTGAGTLNITGNNSEFSGTFNQTNGTTIATGTLFNGGININGGILQLLDGTKFASDTKFNIANGATMDFANATDEIDLDASRIIAAGAVNKTNDGKLHMSGDFSSNTGIFTQTRGTTILADDSKLFGNSASQNIIKGGVLQVRVDDNDELNLPLTLDGGTLEYLSDTGNVLDINNAGLSKIVVSNPTAQIIFNSGNPKAFGEYNLNENLNIGVNTIVFENSHITFGASDYTNGPVYSFQNSTLDLSSPIQANTMASLQNLTFDNLLTDANTWMNIDINYTGTTFVSDTITNTGTAQKIGLGLIKFHNGESDSGNNDEYTVNVLGGNLTFANAQDVSYASGAHLYEVKTTIGGQTVTLTSLGQAGAHSLYTLNAKSGDRVFSLDEYTDDNHVYNIDMDLSATMSGHFTLVGNASGKQTVSGAIVDNSGNLTGTHGKLFQVAEDNTVLFAQNLTFADTMSDNGAVLNQNNATAASYFLSTTFKNNTVSNNGGAIYNAGGLVVINEGASFTNNSAGENGGAIYNADILNLTAHSENSISFSGNTANGVANDIYNTGTINIDGAGDVNIDSGVAGSGKINKSGFGTLNINGNSASYTGEFIQTDGITNATANFFAGTNTISGGQLNFTGNGAQTGGTLNISGGAVSLKNNASLSDTNVSLASGNLVMTDSATTNNVTFDLSEGTLSTGANTIINNGTIALNGGHASISGTINGANTTIADGVLEMQSGSILASGQISMTSDSVGGLVWSGTKKSDAVLSATGGVLVIASNSTLDMNNANDIIAADTKFYVESDSILRNTAGNITVGRDDFIAGTLNNGATVSFNGGAYDYSNSSNGSFIQTNAAAVTNILGGAQIKTGAKSTISGGTINIGGDGVSNSVLAISANTTFAKNVNLNINADNHFVVNGGTATLDGADKLNGTIDLLSGDLYFDNAVLNGMLTATNGTVHIQSGVLNFGATTTVASDVRIMLSDAAKMNVNNGATIEINNNDSLLGMVGLNGGKLIFNGLTKTDDFEIDITGGTLALENGTNWTAHADDSSTASTNIEINNSILNVMAGSGFNTFASVSMQNATFNTMNDAAETYNLGTLTLNGDTANFAMDIDGDKPLYDIFKIRDINGSGNINVSNVRMLSAPKELTINLDIFQVGNPTGRSLAAPLDDVTFTTSIDTVQTAIYTYDFSSNNDGTYTLTRKAGKDTNPIENFNPVVFRGQSSAMALLNHEMSITNMVFDHIYLDTRGCESCNYYDEYTYRSNGIWMKPYYVSETLTGHQNGVDVDSDFYGTIAGLDLRTIRISSKWDFIPTIYGAYTGSKTNNLQQTGLRAGAMGTFTNGRATASLMIYGGMHKSEMDLDGITDSADMNFMGGTIKGAYDFKAGKFIIQPNFTAGYKVFGKQKWDSELGDITMETDAFNGFNAAPGLNVIYAMRNWSAYAMSRYMVQLSECEIKSRADDVELPIADACHNYAEFGLGASANLSRGFSGFMQATGTAGGRTGIGGKIGINWKF
jgi:predicted outer membrane repeat protein